LTSPQERVVGCVRVSTREQAEERHGFDAQRAEIRRAAEARGWEVVAWVEDAGSPGVRLSGRAGRAEAIRLAETGEVDAVVATKIARVRREVVR
jgi:DNA invertase Pin-like site-specific DNA recombinase